MEFNLTFVMIKLLLLCVLISGASTRGVPTADDSEKTLKGRSEKVKSGDSSDLTNCKGCQENRPGGESLSSGEEHKAGNSESTLPKQKPPSFIKPSIRFHRIKVRVNERSRHDPISYLNKNYKNQQKTLKLNTTEQVATDKINVLNKATTARYNPPDSGKDGHNVKLGESSTDTTIEDSEELKASLHKVTDSLKAKTTLNKEEDDVVNPKSTDGKEKEFGISKKSTKPNKKTHDLSDIDREQDTDKSNYRKNIKFVDKAVTQSKDGKETVVTDPYIIHDAESEKDKQNGKTADDVSEKSNNEHSKVDVKLKEKSQPKIGLDSTNKNEQHSSKENYAQDGFKIRPKVMSSRRLVDRWSRKDLSQVPDAARLEWRLHPNLDVPARDILQSVRNMVGFLQQNIQHVNFDFDFVRNTTRWKYMMGVRDGLTTLAEENDIIYTVVLETSLLTKEIYRKAHERRHPRMNVPSVVADYRQRYRDNIGMELRHEQTLVHIEIEKAEQLVERMKERLHERQSLKEEVLRVNHLVRDGLALKALHDLQRRAKQTIHVISVSNPLQNITDRANLYVYMGRDIEGSIQKTKDMLIDGYDIISRTKAIVKANQEKVHQYEMIVQNRLRSPSTVNKIDRVVAWDRATSYARNLTDTAAFTMMKLKPLIQKADEIMSGRSKYSTEKRLETTASHLSEINKQLKLVYDQIIVEIDDERVVKQRCETFEGSGWFDDDEDGISDSLIDCEPYITITESSGDDLEGSGDADGLQVDVYLPEGDFNDDDDNKVDSDISEADISADKEDVIFIDDNEDTLEVVSVTNEPTMKPTTMKSTAPSSLETKMGSKPTTVQTKTTATPSPSTSSSMSTKATTTTTKTTTAAEDKTTEGVIDSWFGGWLKDEPEKGNIDIDLEVREDLLTIDNLLNNLIRQRLSNYSKESKALMDQSKDADSRQNEISLTWVKVKDRFQTYENTTRKVAAFVSKWKAEKHLFHAVHDEVLAANQSVALKTDVVATQSEAAVNKAEKKHESMNLVLETQKKKEKTAADPVEFKQAKDKVTMATENIKEVQRLKQLYPNPCTVLELVDNTIKSNITELRKKIAKAKLLASSLKLAIEVQKDKPMVYNIPQQQLETDPLRTNIQVMLRHSGSDGHVITLNANDEEAVSLKMNENKLEVVQRIDGDEEILNIPDSSNVTDKPYLLEIDRYGTVYNFTLTTSDGGQIKVGTHSLFEEPSAYSSDYLPTSLQIGGEDSLSTCFIGLQVNGYHVDWFKKEQKEEMLPTACEAQTRWLTFDSHLIFEGTGFAMYNLKRGRFKTFLISFNPRSPGTIFVLHDTRHSIMVDAYIDGNNILTLYIKYSRFLTRLVTKCIYGTDHTIKLTFNSGGIRSVDTTLNGQSDVFKVVEEEKRTLIDEKVVGDKLHVGGLPEQNSSFVGCMKSLSVDGIDVQFETFEDAQDIKFGTCQIKNCVEFEDGSKPIEVKSLSSVKVINLVVARGAVGPVLQLSKNKKKFDLTVSVNADGVSIEETVRDNSETIHVDEDAKTIVITVQDEAEDERIKVTVNDESETLSYKVSRGWFIAAEKSDENAIYTYDINIGASTEEDNQFVGTISDFIVDGSLFSLLPYMETNHLAGCQAAPSPIVEAKKVKIYPTMTCA